MSFLGKSFHNAARTVLSSGLALAATSVLASNAFAVSLRVQIACAGDYYAHCSAYSPDSPQVRSCMRAIGTRLSKGCVNALVASGEVSSAEVKRHSSTRTASK
jgi:hypothetical protein